MARRRPRHDTVRVPPRTVRVAHPSPDLYGSDLQMLETVRAYVERGADVRVTVPTDGPLVPLLRDAGCQVLVQPVPVLRKSALSPAGIVRLAATSLRALPAMVRTVRTSDADVVLVNTQTIPLWLVAARLAGVRAVAHVHEAEADVRAVLRVALATPLLLASRVAVNSRYARDVLVAALPRLAGRSDVVYNGVPGPPAGVVARPMPKAGEPVSIALVGRLSPRKGTDVALDAVGLLRDAGRDVRIVLAGTAFAGYEWFEDRLRARAEQDDLAGAVTFAGYADPWEIFDRSHVAVVPSRAEPFGNVAVQAMRAARPVVASRTQGLVEVVRDGATGITVPPGDARALSDALAGLLDDPERARQLALAARADAERRFAPQRYRDEMWDLVAGGDTRPKGGRARRASVVSSSGRGRVQ